MIELPESEVLWEHSGDTLSLSWDFKEEFPEEVLCELGPEE